MSPYVTHVRHLDRYRLELTFSDGLRNVVDFEERVLGRGGVWTALHDVSFFSQARVDPEAMTIVWPNGVDICPDVLYGLASGKSIPTAA